MNNNQELRPYRHSAAARSNGGEHRCIDRLGADRLHRRHGAARNHHPARQAAAARLRAGEDDRPRDQDAGRRHVRDHVRGARHRARRHPGRRAQARRHHGPRQEGRRRRSRASSSIRRSLWTSDEKAIYEEGCLSIPEFYEEVERPAQVRVKYLDLDGKEQELEAERAARHLPAARDRPSQRRAVHRPHLQAQARPRHQEIQPRRRKRARAEVTDCRFASSSWARPTSRCRRWPRSSGAAMTLSAVYTRAPKPAGRGMELKPTPGRARGAPLRASGAHADDPAHAGGAGGLPRARRRCRGGRRLWADPAEADSRRRAARLLQPARLAVAALARRRADQPRHHGGRSPRPA